MPGKRVQFAWIVDATARTLGCGVGTVQRIKAGMGAGAAAPQA
jgi:hypothetical protein